MINITIPGNPVSKARPRFATTKNNRVFAYTNERTASYESFVRLTYLQHYPKQQPLTGALCANIKAYFPIPKSATKKARERMLAGEWHTKKVDCDNIAKICLDALNGVAYGDDSQVSRLEVEKAYSETPRVEISLWELENENENK